MRTITVNGNKYGAKEFNLNLICDLSDLGVSMEKIASMDISFLRAYVTLCSGKNVEDAGNEIEQHFIANDGIAGIIEEIKPLVEESGFFRKIIEMAEKGNLTENTEKKTEKKVTPIKKKTAEA